MRYEDVPGGVVSELRKICGALPETTEREMSAGFVWQIRKRNFAQVMTYEDLVLLMFRSEPPELGALHHAGHPFFKPGWGKNAVGMILDDGVDWAEVAELLADSYCLLAPKKLAQLLNGSVS